MWSVVLLLLLAASAVVGRTAVVPVADCSQFQQALNPTDGLTISFTSILDNSGVGPNGYLRVRMVYEGKGWLGFAITPNGFMVPSFAIIGLPGEANNSSNPGKYRLGGLSPSSIYLLNQTQQTLQNASIFQNSSHTVLTFTKRIHENGEYRIHGNGSNTFLYAIGGDNEFAIHASARDFSVTLRPCIDGAPVVMTPAPSLYPTLAPSPVANLDLPFTPYPTATVTTLPPGTSSSPTATVSSSPTLGIFDSTELLPDPSPSAAPSTRVQSTKSPSRGPTKSPSRQPIKSSTSARPTLLNPTNSSLRPTIHPSLTSSSLTPPMKNRFANWWILSAAATINIVWKCI